MVRGQQAARIVAAMQQQRRMGCDFEEAFRTAAQGVFGRDEEASYLWFKKVCDDAWHGRRPALRHFSPELLIGSMDWSENASKAHVVLRAA